HSRRAERCGKSRPTNSIPEPFPHLLKHIVSCPSDLPPHLGRASATQTGFPSQAAPGPGSPGGPGRPWQALRWHNLTVAMLGNVHGNCWTLRASALTTS
ncbi:hypothetical protein BN1723_015016, partial [Verticillium longisporum]